MTRKSYELVAYRMAMAEPVNSAKVAHAAWNKACESLSTGFIFDNPRFKSSLFIKACKFEYWKNRQPPHAGPLG